MPRVQKILVAAPCNNNMKKKILASALLMLSWFLISPAYAADVCCRCGKARAGEYCLTSSTQSCGDISTNEVTCDTGPLTPTQCRPVTSGGECQSGPMSVADFENSQRGSAANSSQTGKPVNLITPNLGVPIPGLTFANQSTPENGYISIPFLAQYITAGYRYLIGVSVIAAIIMVTYGGFRYLLGSAMGDVKRGKTIIFDAIMGLVVLLSAYLILQTVNPATLSLDAIRIQSVGNDTPDEGDVDPNPQPVEQTARPGQAAPVSCVGQPGIVCSDEASCKPICDKGPTQWPACSPNVADPTLTEKIPNTTGIDNSAGQSILSDLLPPIKKAGEIAAAQGYTIEIISGYRPLKKQIKIACDKIKAHEGGDIGGIVAKPGGSNHGRGRAIDIQLVRGKDVLVTSSNAHQRESKYKDPAQLLSKIMTEVGFKRYNREIWHFEYGTNSGCRCSYPNCPWPPPSKC